MGHLFSSVPFCFALVSALAINVPAPYIYIYIYMGVSHLMTPGAGRADKELCGQSPFPKLSHMWVVQPETPDCGKVGMQKEKQGRPMNFVRPEGGR